MHDARDNHDRLHELLAQIGTAELSSEQRAELVELLCDDPDAQDEFVKCVSIHAWLQWRSASNELPHGEDDRNSESDQPSAGAKTTRLSTAHLSPLTPHPSHSSRRNLGYGMIAGVIFLAGLFTWAATTYLPGIAKHDDAPATDTSDKVVAWLMNAHDVEWTEGGVPESTQYKAGQRLAIKKGLVEIHYATGARVAIEGPAEFVVGGKQKDEGGRKQGTAAERARKKAGRGSGSRSEDENTEIHPSSFRLHPSKNSGYLALGSLVASCELPESKGFTIATPAASVVDFGTQFGVEVLESGAADVVVLEGAVEVQTDDDRKELVEGQSATITLSGISITRTSKEELLRRFARFVVAPPRSFESDWDLIRVDLQLRGSVLDQHTNAGWTRQDLDHDAHMNPKTSRLHLTTAGTAAGITATLAGDTDGWEARGGSPHNRAQVTGTSFNDVVEDLWATRDEDATIAFTGLSVGGEYTLQVWHNDSFTINAGFATGGGTVTPSVVGGTLVSSSAGTITNLNGAQADGAFGITSIVFIATAANATVTLDGNSRNGFLPINAIRFTSAPPEKPIQNEKKQDLSTDVDDAPLSEFPILLAMCCQKKQHPCIEF
ncbi:MAG: FecR family protein [Pirellulales bacterium]|nr:FecR family protein [Pirellulales bacterium]